MDLSNLKPKVRKPARKRKGQGNAAGQGTYGGRGMNGQNARAGGGVRPGFEGGQSGLLMRMPKLPGFRNPNRVEAETVSLSKVITAFAKGGKVTPITLSDAKVVSGKNSKIKVLFDGAAPEAKLELEGVLVSKAAKAAIEKAGGTVS